MPTEITRSFTSGSRLWWFALAIFAAPITSFAQTDEIQVYDASIAEKGKFNLMLHNNFTPKGSKDPAYPGAVISNHAYVGVAEWAYGATDWFEAGLYMPLYSFSQGATFNGYKLRALFVKPHAEDHTFFYGVNFEFSVNQKQWDPRHYTSEIRPIVGLHLKPVDIIVNPIMDTSYTGGFKELDFAPSVRVAYNFNKNWAGAIEEYADYGPFRGILPVSDQSHQIWAVANHTTKWFEFETGVGHGVTAASDKWTIKFMISRDLN
jgi:hypothetical protein